MIELENVNLWRRTQEEYAYDLKRTIFAVIARRYKPPRRRHVLRDVSLRVQPGERIGIIGPNGSGKSTTLKVIAGILKPTSGTVRVTGTIAPLIELGAGFDPDLSVIDNIEYYGIMLGRDGREARRSIDGVLEFSELADHANEPLKVLSSGMVARLGFAVATETTPDILILDEVLSVGDDSFRRKCSDRIQRFLNERCTVLVVSHDTNFVRAMADRAIYLDRGEVIADGPAAAVAERYEEAIRARTAGLPAIERVDAATIASSENRVFRGNGTTFEEQKIFIIRDGRKHWIMDSNYLIRAGIDWPYDVTFVEGGVLETVPEGEPIL